jgi:flagellar biosynthesis protein
VALAYRPPSDLAPRVIAKGNGALAERILALARHHEIPIHDDPALVAVLSLLEIEASVPPELYRAVAEVIAFVYRLGAAARASGQSTNP